MYPCTTSAEQAASGDSHPVRFSGVLFWGVPIGFIGLVVLGACAAGVMRNQIITQAHELAAVFPHRFALSLQDFDFALKAPLVVVGLLNFQIQCA